VTATLAFNWIPIWALPSGAAVGLAWAVLSLLADRRRLRRRLCALVRNLPLLVAD
jgi:hypothetical protein